MTGVATTVELSPTGIDGDNFDISSLRGEDFSSGIDEGRSADADEAASSLDLVAVAGGKEKLDTFMDGSTDLKDMPAPVDALSLASKSEINSSENRMSDERRAAICQGVASAACASCAARDDCPILRMRNFANENLQPAPERESYLRDLLNDDDDGIVVAGYANPDSGADSTNADITETSDDKTDKLIEQVAPPNQGNEIPTSETTESPDEPADIKEAEQSFLEPAIATEDAADDVDEIREAQPENVSGASVNTSGEEYFTEPTEENRPSIEIKQQTFDVISGAADKENQQPAFESPDILMQTKTRTVPSSPGVSEDTQTGDENRNSLKNETVYPTASDDKDTASVIENTYDGDETTAPSSVKIPSIEHQKESEFVIAGSKSASSEPSRAAENDESATPVSEHQHLAAQFEAVKADESATTGPIDNSGTKASIDAQPSEISVDAAADYNNFVESIDSVNAEQPKRVTPTATNMPPSQAQEDAVNVSAEYETNETSTEKMVNAAESIPAKEQPDQPVIVSLSTQDIVEYGESSLSAGKECTVDRSPIRPNDVVSIPTTHEVIEATHEANETIELEAMNVTLPAAAVAVSEGKSQIDLPPELSEELAVDKSIYEAQTSLIKQLDHNHVAVKYDYGEDSGVWAEEDVVFLVEQQSPVVEPGVSSAEVVTVAPMETIIVREEYGDLKLSVDDEIGVGMESAGQLDNFKTSSVPGITNDYEPEEQIAIPTSPAIEPIRDVELDEPAVEILEERIMPREECDNIVMEASEKSDLPRVDDEVETITMDTSGIESAVDLSEAQEELVATEVSEAVESEVDEQNDLAVDSAVDSYSYNSETSAVSDNVLVVKGRPSPGLWPDDSRLNPEEESASTAQSSADDASLISRLVGMFVVAMCVVRGRQSVKV